MFQRYVFAWIHKDEGAFYDLFEDDVTYSECYGPEYRGLSQVHQWFTEWNERGTVLQWDIKRFLHEGNDTVVEWFFKCLYTGKVEAFDGVSWITFRPHGKIIQVKEFQSKSEHHHPCDVHTIDEQPTIHSPKKRSVQ
ncbi:MAG TPA: nuclear transport factor 2 family protein [Thermotogota bacterium]|nr:nuclear transport factor 2 family protein [Thermotogota bacterium]HPH11433.1 nuclear transport factor 2 family protein [Thermotogota bacterium]HQQ66630.1 nuclear transport factor 2 family protein [Thermotogota bacterium]